MTNSYKQLSINGKHIDEHRYIMEQHLGRKLERNEYVHHKNGNETELTLSEIIENLIKNNKRLANLCNKYEEEHKTTFLEWKKDIQANKKAIAYIKTQQVIFANYDIVIEEQLDNLLNILQGSDKE